MATKKAENIWFFEVSDPQLHPKGFTIYKLTCKVFPISQPERLTEVVIWKRYNDFKQLHKAMLTLHKALHRREEFPPFAKPKLFGRFDDEVIEERRQSALDLLNFLGRFSHLYKSQVFEKFLQGGKITQGSSGPPALRPSKLDILSSDNENGNPPPDVVPVLVTKQQNSEDTDCQEKSEEPTPTSEKSTLSVNGGAEDVRILEGTWNFPQPPDNISLDSTQSFGEAGDTDLDSPLGTSLPDTDITMFDPLVSNKSGELESSMTRSNSWLVTALNVCVQLEEEEKGEEGEGEGEEETLEEELVEGDENAVTPQACPEEQVNTPVSGHEDVTFDIGEFDPLRERSESKVECGKGDIDLSLPSSPRTSISSSNSFQAPSSSARSSSLSASPAHLPESLMTSPVRSTRSATASPAHKPGSLTVSPARKSGSLTASPAHKSGGSLSASPTHRGAGSRSHSPSPARKPRAGTGSSVSNMDLGGKEDYIYLAAHQICLAQEHEANANYEMAFTCYKTGVGILLQGVQGDSNKSRRDAVRRKTAQYLMKAEDLYNLHMAQETADERRWASTDITLSPSLDLDPSLAFIRGSISELRNYKVLGTVDRVVLVMDRATDETYVIKSIHKAAVQPTQRLQTILPPSCPYMVSLFKFYETHNAIYLLLQYATGGKLWTYIGSYLQNQDSLTGGGNSPVSLYPRTSRNVYSGQKVHQDAAAMDFSQGHSTPKSEPPEKSDQPPARISIGPDTSKGRVVRFSNQIMSPDEENENISVKENDSLKPDYRRLSSLSSDEGQAASPRVISDGHDNLSLNDSQDFQQMLDQTKPSLEQFSINSFDSDGFCRLDSNISDHIESIPEEDSSPLSQPSEQIGEQTHSPQPLTDDVFPSDSSIKRDKRDNQLDESELSLDAQRIVASSKELIKLVDRVLSESGEFDNPDLESPDPMTTSSHSHDSTELSIYDNHQVHDSDISESEETKDKSDFPSVPDQETQASEETSTAAPTVSSRTIPKAQVCRKVSLSRINSKDLTRSASFECDLKSPTKNRARTMSELFTEMDSVSAEVVKLPESCIKTWAAEIVCALSHLHALGIVCKDLHPNNILLGEQGHVMLSYFYQIGQIDKQLDVELVDNLYVAPEVCSINGYTEVSDWWSFGALLYELLTGSTLSSFHPGKITSHTQLHIPTHVSPEGQSLLRELLCYDPRERLGSGLDGAEALKAHPFFTDINWNTIENL